MDGSMKIWPIDMRPSCICNYFPRFALIQPHFLLRPYSGQELIIQATGKMVFLYNTFINPSGNLNHSFALIRTTERLAVESTCIRCRSGSCSAGCGQWRSPVRPEHENLGPAGEYATLGCPSNISVPAEKGLGDKTFASAINTCLAAFMVTLIITLSTKV